MYKLRPYQQEAVDKTLEFFRKNATLLLSFFQQALEKV
jgi:superfamily II DNA or RNA helicase